MIASLNTFLEHMKYTMALMSSLVAGGMALLAFLLKNAPAKPEASPTKVLVLVASTVCFVLVALLAYMSERIVYRYYRYYKVYASNQDGR